MRKKLLLVLILGSLFLAACGGAAAPAALESIPAEYAGKTNPLGADAASDGAKVFHLNCEACHGPHGHGDGPAGAVIEPPPSNLPELAKLATDDYFFWRIRTGKPGTSMPPWSGILNDEQIWQAITYIRTLE
jgi:high-affinity iron transporter